MRPTTNDCAKAIYDAEVGPTVDLIKPMLAGKDPAIQGAILAELLAIFLAGHHPSIRDDILALHVEAVIDLVTPIERERSDAWPSL